MNIRRILQNKWIARLFVLFTVLSSISLAHSIWLSSHRPNHTPEQAMEVERLQQQANQLRNDVEQVNDPFFQEKTIRDELNMQKEGEVILQIPDLPVPTAAPPATATPTPEVYEKWLEVLRK